MTVWRSSGRDDLQRSGAGEGRASSLIAQLRVWS
jgi:hypothetical protein